MTARYPLRITATLQPRQLPPGVRHVLLTTWSHASEDLSARPIQATSPLTRRGPDVEGTPCGSSHQRRMLPLVAVPAVELDDDPECVWAYFQALAMGFELVREEL